MMPPPRRLAGLEDARVSRVPAPPLCTDPRPLPHLFFPFPATGGILGAQRVVPGAPREAV